MKRRSFTELLKLYEMDPKTYRIEIRRMRSDEPARFDRFVERFRRELDAESARDAKPLTSREVASAVDTLAASLGWSRQRVLAEAVLRLQASNESGELGETLTQDEKPRPRRLASARAIILGR